MVTYTDKTLHFTGDLRKDTIPMLLEQTGALLRRHRPTQIDISKVDNLDSAGVAFLESLEDRIKRYSKVVFLSGVPTHLKPILQTFSSREIPPQEKPYIPGYFETVGGAALERVRNFILAWVMTADVFYWSIMAIFYPGGQRRGSLAQQGYILGVQALPVVTMLSLIIGFILSLQSAAQLKNFGANVFIADLLSLSLVREMGPMMTAIIVAGRSGSSIASEIASMQVSEEIDALRMMAINPIRYVVVPKFHAMTLVMPVLVAISVFIGEIGGLIIAVGYLDLSFSTFIERSLDIIVLKDIIVSLIKSTFFGWAIVIIGSHYGFAVRGGAVEVGRATTNAVVSAIFTVIIIDALFSLLYLQ